MFIHWYLCVLKVSVFWKQFLSLSEIPVDTLARIFGKHKQANSEAGEMQAWGPKFGSPASYTKLRWPLAPETAVLESLGSHRAHFWMSLSVSRGRPNRKTRSECGQGHPSGWVPRGSSGRRRQSQHSPSVPPPPFALSLPPSLSRPLFLCPAVCLPPCFLHLLWEALRLKLWAKTNLTRLKLFLW